MSTTSEPTKTQFSKEDKLKMMAEIKEDRLEPFNDFLA